MEGGDRQINNRFTGHRGLTVPFAASAAWYRRYYLLGGRELPPPGRDAARTLIRGNAEPLRLSIPVEGGAARLKHPGADPAISPHGNWRALHLGAWNAAYGRTPFFIHLFPEIEAIYASIPDGAPISRLNSAFHLLATHWLDEGAAHPLPPRCLPRADELAAAISPHFSIFDAIFRFGIETGLSLRASSFPE